MMHYFDIIRHLYQLNPKGEQGYPESALTTAGPAFENVMQQAAIEWDHRSDQDQ